VLKATERKLLLGKLITIIEKIKRK